MVPLAVPFAYFAIRTVLGSTGHWVFLGRHVLIMSRSPRKHRTRD
jgi:hypothetical protein